MKLNDLSRRETLQLARFGALLAGGLGVASQALAKTASKDAPAMGTSAFTVKLYYLDAAGKSIMEEIVFPEEATGGHIAPGAALTFKFWYPGSATSVKTRPGASMVHKIKSASFVFKFRDTAAVSSEIFKLNVTPNEMTFER